jgi:RimJ/RimL family protein N-acetyltransferase
VATTPPYRIETERLVIRCWEPRDAPLLKEAIDESLEHLRPWMDWAQNEPSTLDEKIELLRGFRGEFDLGTNFVYGIFARDETSVLGGTGLHPHVGDGALEIGYWIRVSAVGSGLATEATAALTRAAFAWFGVDRVEIKVDPDNAASLAVPRRLGYVEDATLRRRLPPFVDGAERRDSVVFSMFADEVAGSPARGVELEAYDASGRRLA